MVEKAAPITIRSWLNKHKPEIEKEAIRRDVSPVELVIIMLEDALEAYKEGRLDED